jgi:DNA-binding transcriptional ArsR family regulator
MRCKKEAVDLTDLAMGVLVLGIVVSVEQRKALANPTRLEIVEELLKSKEPLSLMELSRRVDSSKTNIQHHLDILKETKIVYVESSQKTQHNPLLINLNREIKKKALRLA